MNSLPSLARSLVVFGAVVSAGCASHYTVTMNQEVAPTFLGSSSPELDATSYKKAVVVPPSTHHGRRAIGSSRCANASSSAQA